MKAVVTGGAGFIGSHLVDALVARGASVLVVDDFSTGREANLTSSRQSGRVEVLTHDICSPDVKPQLKQFEPDTVFHLGAQMNVRRSVADPVFDAEKNVLGIVNLLESARCAGAKRFVFSSTGGAIYGEQDTFPADENHSVRPECPYGVSKRAGELYLEYFSRFYNSLAISLRFANVYGPRQNAKGEAGVVAIFCDRLLAGEPLTVFGDGLQTRDFVFGGDVVDACMRASQIADSTGFRVYNVGRGVETSVLDLVSAMKTSWTEICGGQLPAPVIVQHAPALIGEQRRSVISPEKIERELGWQPRVDFVAGLRQTIEYARGAALK